jgi:transcription antitermination factor NusA-like protein
VRLAIGTLGKNISVSDNLTGTRHIDIRVRRNNRPQSGGGVAAGQAVVTWQRGTARASSAT